MTEKINWEILALTRFLLAFVVMAGHLTYFSASGYFNWYANLGSFEAILGFLLISGLSIGKSILKNKETYFKRRIQRIYPVYLASILFQIFVVGSALTFPSVFTLVLNLLFLNQIFTATSFVGPAWTLAVEVWLYTLAPLFLKLKKKTLYTLIFLSFSCYLFYECGRTLFHWNYYSGTRFGINLVLLAFIWIAGFVLAIYPGGKKQHAILVALLLGGHLALSFGVQILSRIKHDQLNEVLHTDITGFIGKTICLVGVYCVIIYNGKIPPFQPSIAKIFNLLGNISYPLYLSHFTTFRLLENAGVKNDFVFVSSALVMSYLIYFVFDFYSKRRGIKTVAAKRQFEKSPAI